jgi:hypothetical protein
MKLSTRPFFTLAVLGTAACNPGAFDSLLDRAPVVDFGTPGASTGAVVALALPPPADANSQVAARMLVSRKDDRYLAAADFAKNGKVTLREAADRSNMGPDSTAGVRSLARLANGTVIVGMPGFVLSGAPVGRISFVTLQAQADGGLALAIAPPTNGPVETNHYGIAVATGNISGASASESVVVADEIVDVLDSNGVLMARTACGEVQMNAPATRNTFRPIAVGDLLTGGGDEIVLGGQANGQGPGRVVFLQYDGSPNLVCSPGNKLLVHGASTGFGASLAIDDFNGDGKLDLAVGAPPDQVHIYFGPLDNVVDPSVTISGAASSTGFGQRIAAYHVPGQAAAQLLVADPSATVGQRVGGGAVMLFNISGMPSSLPAAAAIATLFDSSDDVQPGVFAMNLGAVPFNTGTCQAGGATQLVPWASSGTQILTYFAYPSGAADPRCFGK